MISEASSIQFSVENLEKIKTALSIADNIVDNLAQVCFQKILETCKQRNWSDLEKIHTFIKGLHDNLGRSIFRALFQEKNSACLSDLTEKKNAHLLNAISDHDDLGLNLGQMIAMEKFEKSQLSLPNYFLNPPEYLVFQGGGCKGPGHLGALQALEEKGLLKNIKAVCGTSAGSLVALAVALNFDLKELEELMLHTPMYTLLAPTSFKGGLCSTKNLRAFIANLIKKKTNDEDLTFGELGTRIEKGEPFKFLHVIATRVGANKEIVEFNCIDERWNRLIIADAIVSSMALPWLFEPHILNFKSLRNHRIRDISHGSFMDGGILANAAVETFDTNRYVKNDLSGLSKEQLNFSATNIRTLCFTFGKQEAPKMNTQVHWFLSVAPNVLKVLMDAENLIRAQRQFEINRHRIVKMDTQDLTTISFFASPNQVEKGIKSCKENVQKRLKDHEMAVSPPSPQQVVVQEISINSPKKLTQQKPFLVIASPYHVKLTTDEEKQLRLDRNLKVTPEETKIFTFGSNAKLFVRTAKIGIIAASIFSGIFSLGVGGMMVKMACNESLASRTLDLLALDDSRFLLFVYLKNGDTEYAEYEYDEHKAFFKQLSEMRTFRLLLRQSKQEYIRFFEEKKLIQHIRLNESEIKNWFLQTGGNRGPGGGRY